MARDIINFVNHLSDDFRATALIPCEDSWCHSVSLLGCCYFHRWHLWWLFWRIISTGKVIYERVALQCRQFLLNREKKKKIENKFYWTTPLHWHFSWWSHYWLTMGSCKQKSLISCFLLDSKITNFGHLIFGHFLSHFGQILDKNFGHSCNIANVNLCL